ncbi:DUF1043 family protein [uncultured Salinisphaera sp.]|uniref:YhcB family protein n=1 Tax=uncultured Salinisphaera sp. TaxID=359372 RepID=UPI0032B20055|tara:strand:+ start:118 stop:576 length:459 start_codon:yes stop_codon:yes gene_type:complete
MTPVIWIIIAAVCAVIALLAGYFIGNKAGGSGPDRSAEIAAQKKEHDDFRGDVREHFQQTAAIMSRMAEDYRDMQEHMAHGAERLADMDREKLTGSASTDSVGHDKQAAAKKPEASPNQLGSTMDAKVNGGKPSETPSRQPSDAAVKAAPKK